MEYGTQMVEPSGVGGIFRKKMNALLYCIERERITNGHQKWRQRENIYRPVVLCKCTHVVTSFICHLERTLAGQYKRSEPSRRMGKGVHMCEIR